MGEVQSTIPTCPLAPLSEVRQNFHTLSWYDFLRPLLPLPCQCSLTHQIRACHSVDEGYELVAAPFSRQFPVREPESGMQSKSALRQGDWMGDLDGAKILILWIEKLHLQRVPKFVDRREAVDLKYKSPC